MVNLNSRVSKIFPICSGALIIPTAVFNCRLFCVTGLPSPSDQSNLFKRIIRPSSSIVYVNPVCKEMDALINSCETPEQLLTLVVTHRGVMYLQNLVFLVRSLAILSYKQKTCSYGEISSTKSFGTPASQVRRDVDAASYNFDSNRKIQFPGRSDTCIPLNECVPVNNPLTRIPLPLPPVNKETGYVLPYNNNSPVYESSWYITETNVISNYDREFHGDRDQESVQRFVPSSTNDLEGNFKGEVPSIVPDSTNTISNQLDEKVGKTVVISDFSRKSNSESDKIYVIDMGWIIQDERFLILIDDIIRNRNNFDLKSIYTIFLSLRLLKFTNSILYNNFKRPIYRFLTPISCFIEEKFFSLRNIYFKHTDMNGLHFLRESQYYGGDQLERNEEFVIEHPSPHQQLVLNRDFSTFRNAAVNMIRSIPWLIEISYNYISQGCLVHPIHNEILRIIELYFNCVIILADVVPDFPLITWDANCRSVDQSSDYKLRQRQVCGMDIVEFVNVLKTFALLPTYSKSFFISVEHILMNATVSTGDLADSSSDADFKQTVSLVGNSVTEKISLFEQHFFLPEELVLLGDVFSRHSKSQHKSICGQIFYQVAKYDEFFKVSDLTRVLLFMKKVCVLCGPALHAICSRLARHIHTAGMLRQKASIDIYSMGIIFDVLSYFCWTGKSDIKGDKTTNSVLYGTIFPKKNDLSCMNENKLSSSSIFDESFRNFIQDVYDENNIVDIQDMGAGQLVVDRILRYLEDFIDEIDEYTSIHGVYLLALFGWVSRYEYIFTFLFRTIGKTTEWEKHRYKVFQIFIAQQLDFPFIKFNIHQRCVYESFRHWLKYRGGYHSLFPKEVQQVAKVISDIAMVMERAIGKKKCVEKVQTHNSFFSPEDCDQLIGERSESMLENNSTVLQEVSEIVGYTSVTCSEYFNLFVGIPDCPYMIDIVVSPLPQEIDEKGIQPPRNPDCVNSLRSDTQKMSFSHRGLLVVDEHPYVFQSDSFSNNQYSYRKYLSSILGAQDLKVAETVSNTCLGGSDSSFNSFRIDSRICGYGVFDALSLRKNFGFHIAGISVSLWRELNEKCDPNFYQLTFANNVQSLTDLLSLDPRYIVVVSALKQIKAL